MTTIFENWYNLGTELDFHDAEEVSSNAADSNWDTDRLHGIIRSHRWDEPDEPAEYDVRGYELYLDECAHEFAYMIADGAEVTTELIQDVRNHIFDVSSVVMTDDDWYDYSITRWIICWD